MATSAIISIAQYLETSYRPDCDFVDGEVKERNLGKFEHARLQALLAAALMQFEGLRGVIVLTEQRTRVSLSRVRIPDVAVVRHGPVADVLDEPPVLAVEILSPEDSYPAMRSRCLDYVRMGVENIWIIDPSSRSACTWYQDRWVEVTRLSTPGDGLYVDLEALFRDLDASRIR